MEEVEGWSKEVEGWSMQVKNRVLVVSVALAAVVASADAHATCNPPAPGIAWTSPADGATEVPTNAAIWLILANWHRPAQLTINGVAVPVAEFPFLYRPTPLAPRTRYDVRVVATPETVTPPVELGWAFTTGDSPASDPPPPPPTVDTVLITKTRAFDAVCTAVWSDCYDTGQDTHLLFNDTGPTPLAWLLERVAERPDAGETSTFRLWPSICGTPELYLRGPTPNCFGPHRIYAADVTGATTARDLACPLSTPAPKLRGCAVSPAPSPASIFLAFLLIAAVIGLRAFRR
jgi:hypothetical protein